MTTCRYSNLTELWHGTCQSLLFGSITDLTVASLTVMQFDQVLEAESMEYEMDLSRELWMTRGRFTNLQRDYIDPPGLDLFLDRVEKMSPRRPQLAQMLCRPKGQRHVSYKWGNCILGFTFRRAPRPVMTMHSRTTAITRMGGLDLALAWCVAQEVAEVAGMDARDFRFVWHVDSVQHSTLNGTPYFYAHGHDSHLEDPSGLFPNEDFPAIKLMRRQFTYFDKLDAAGNSQKHGTRRRVREQRREFLEGRLKRPSVPLHTLSLNGLED